MSPPLSARSLRPGDPSTVAAPGHILAAACGGLLRCRAHQGGWDEVTEQRVSLLRLHFAE
jgi:hypothetical protein